MKPKEPVVHKEYEIHKFVCGVWCAIRRKSTYDWEHTTCKNCLRSKPKPKGKR